MSYQDTTSSRIQAHLESLRQQEEDARVELARPGVQPWIREQLTRLMARLITERTAIEKSLRDSEERQQAS